MNPIRRQGIPLSVRRLLTDIAPKGDLHCSEWDEAEPQSVTTDGVVLPSRGGSAIQEEFLTPARKPDDDTKDHRQTPVCGLCQSKASCYTCPRCNVPYCGLACYRSPDHSACSEEFYKESVLHELKDMGQTEAEGRKKMQDVLLGLRRKADSMEGGMESILREAGIDSVNDDEGGGEVKRGAQVLELLSQLAELQQSGEGSTAEVEGILRKLKELDGEEGGDGEQMATTGVGDADAFEGGEEEETDLSDRLSGLDLDTLSEEALWGMLNSKEKEGFVNLLKGGAMGGLVPLWKPWWEEHGEGNESLVKVLEAEEERQLEAVDGGRTSPVNKLSGKQVNIPQEMSPNQADSGKRLRKTKERNGQDANSVIVTNSLSPTVPPISVKIPNLSSLTASPSPLLGYGLVNALFGYAFTLHLYNGDVDSLTLEFCDTVLAVSEALSSSRVFSFLQEAIEGGEAAILTGGYFDKEDPDAPARAVEAVAHIMTGRSRTDSLGYCLSALCQLHSALSRARAALPKGEEDKEKRQRLFLSRKKCEFFLAWVSDNTCEIRRLAIGLWNDHSKRSSKRITLEKEKRSVEESWKKGKRMGNSVLIEELRQ